MQAARTMDSRDLLLSMLACTTLGSSPGVSAELGLLSCLRFRLPDKMHARFAYPRALVATCQLHRRKAEPDKPRRKEKLGRVGILGHQLV